MTLAHEFTWIRDNQALAALCTECAGRDAVFIDTEFVRRTTFFAKVGLIQIATGEDYYLIDPLLIDSWQPLSDLLVNPAVIKVMHSCSEDVDVFHHLLGVQPAPLFDTQIACALAGLDYGLGFARMVAHFCDIELDKGETTSNWLARPLSDSQCQYAVADVVWLIPCYRQLHSLLTQQARLAWVIEDGANMIRNHVCMQSAESLYTRMKGIGKLNPQELAICKHLCAWRDNTSRELDRPKSRVISDPEIISLARKPPYDNNSLDSYGFGYGWTKRFAKPAVAAVRLGQNEAKEDCPDYIDYERQAKPLLTAMRAIVKTVATDLKLADTALAGKKDLLALLASLKQNDSLSPAMSGWRKSLVGEKLQQLVRDF